jgi:hypothetical protein
MSKISNAAMPQELSKNRNEKMNQETTCSGGGADTADVIQV